MTRFAKTRFDDICRNLQTTHKYVCASSYRFRNIKLLFFYLENRSRSRSAIFAMMPFYGKYQNQQTSLLTFFMFVKCDLCERFNRHKDTQTPKRTSPWLYSKSCRFAKKLSNYNNISHFQHLLLSSSISIRFFK